jgi:hypothetical protein
MRHMVMGSLVVVSALALVGCGGEPGGATPEEVMTRADAALTDHDPDALALLVPLEEGKETEHRQKASMMVSMYRVSKVMEAARSKYGQQQVRQALGQNGLMFSMMRVPDFATIVKEGELETDGDAATYRFRDKNATGFASLATQRVKLMRQDGRWYFDPSETNNALPGGEDLAKAEQLLAGLVTAMESALADHDDAPGFAKAVTGEMEKLGRTMRGS